MRYLLVSHNAGGAAVLAAWAAHQSAAIKFDCLLSGPAVGVFCQRLTQANFIALSSVVLSRYDVVLTSTSSAETAWETRLISQGRAQGIKTISMLDHWTNYVSRFLWLGQQVFPDEIWVCDSYALALAQNCQQQLPEYPPVQQITNFYLQDLVRYIQARRKPTISASTILFVSEPSNNSLYTAQQALEQFLEYISAQSMEPINVRLRLHPREQLEEYAPLLSRWQGRIGIELSSNARLEDDLCVTGWVVGCQTMAMVVAQAAGIKVASCLPASVVTSALPHQEIPRLFPYRHNKY